MTLEKETILFCRAAGIPIEIIRERIGLQNESWKYIPYNPYPYASIHA